MPYPVMGVFMGFILTLVWFAVVVLIDVYREMRNPAVVTCPTVGLDTAVRLHPAGERPQVTGCSRWPAHRTCTQACVDQIPQAARHQSKT